MSEERNLGLKLDLSSPFMECISECRSRMKKLRKKIYKNLKNKQHLQPQTPKTNKSFNINHCISQTKIPEFLTLQSPQPSRDTIIKDISNLSLSIKVTHFQLKVYADQQEKEVQQIMSNMAEKKYHEYPQQEFSEDHSTEDKVPSRVWLQSTQMEYDDSSLMEPHSKISLKPFELFGEEQSKQSCFKDLRQEVNGFISLDSNELFQQQLFQF